ncbi:MAG: hypothetical protein KC416_05585 [Myxococcales bacterium]|nr:hypothetical protein [Myxococcales bacterium]
MTRVFAIGMSPLVFLSAAALGGCATTEGPQPQATPLHAALFRATHNSYSGQSRGTIPEQLDAGVRFIELDVYREDGAFVLGHGAPGAEVALGDGNPTTIDLAPWVDLLAEWRSDHTEDALLTLGVDVKTPLSPAETDALAEVFEGSFGAALTPGAEVSGDTIAESLQGKVLVILSGDRSTRQALIEGGDGTLVVEYQGGDPETLEGPFRAVTAVDGETLAQWAEEGAVTRAWALNDPVYLEAAPITYPATDTPYEDWYEEHCVARGALR